MPLWKQIAEMNGYEIPDVATKSSEPDPMMIPNLGDQETNNVTYMSQSSQQLPQQASIPSEQMTMTGFGLSNKAAVNNEFGTRSGALYGNSFHRGIDIPVPRGTKVSVPDGSWVVVNAFGGATAEGPNNSQRNINNRYGNSIVVMNEKTGEKLRFSHLMPGGVLVKPGQKLTGGNVVGMTGATGNVAGATGNHLDLEYYDSKGNLKSARQSPYANYYIGQ
jgi:murein DD-endopeptidase MepM/ murein hydrolase activator NlpD